MALEVDDLSFDLHVSFNYTPQWRRKQFESWGGGVDLSKILTSKKKLLGYGYV